MMERLRTGDAAIEEITSFRIFWNNTSEPAASEGLVVALIRPAVVPFTEEAP